MLIQFHYSWTPHLWTLWLAKIYLYTPDQDSRHLHHHSDTNIVSNNLSRLTRTLPDEVKQRDILPSRFSFPMCPFHGLFSAAFATFAVQNGLQAWWLKGCLVFLSARRLWCAYKENTHVRWALFRHEVVLLTVRSVLMNQLFIK